MGETIKSSVGIYDYVMLVVDTRAFPWEGQRVYYIHKGKTIAGTIKRIQIYDEDNTLFTVKSVSRGVSRTRTVRADCCSPVSDDVPDRVRSGLSTIDNEPLKRKISQRRLIERLRET